MFKQAAAAAVLGLATSVAVADPITFVPTDYTGWTRTVVYDSSYWADSSFGGQSQYQVDLTLRPTPGGGERFREYVALVDQRFSYDPRVSGPIKSILFRFGLDGVASLLLDGATQWSPYFRPVIRQAGTVFVCDTCSNAQELAGASGTFQWTALPNSASFDVAGSLTGSPDFTGASGPISFGFRYDTGDWWCPGPTGSICQSPGSSSTILSKYSVTITPAEASTVPEPGMLALLGLGALTACVRRRRTR